MAPYALTPTFEGDELPEGSWLSPSQNIAHASGTPTPSTTSIYTNNIHPSSHTNGNNGHSITPHPAETSTNNCTNEPSRPKSTTSYEDAFVHGFKDGYSSGFTKAHIELKHQPVAITGMSCRFPGSVSSPDEFWELLARNRTGFSAIPASRFSSNRFHHSNPGKGGTTNARGGNCKYLLMVNSRSID
jgi:hypothetical protein